ncbi:PAS domain-containing protein [Tribonema minus]|uniref:PAS domain-containing protein n=1 Tax=Tribonema minus TaxID=303371 RepID=A0A835Z4M9_9STRA|nr:PAS domain-containing protein [Tribonema minus]
MGGPRSNTASSTTSAAASRLSHGGGSAFFGPSPRSTSGFGRIASKTRASIGGALFSGSNSGGSARGSGGGGSSAQRSGAHRRSIDGALAASSKAWSGRGSEDADDWLGKFVRAAEGFPACIVVSEMTVPGAPMVFVNAEFCRVTGYSKVESIGRNCRFLQGPETEPDAVDTIRRTLSKGLNCNVRITNYRKNGEKFTNLLSMKPVFDAEGIYRYVIGVQFEVVADETLETQLLQLDKLLKSMPNRLEPKALSAQQRRQLLMQTAIGATSVKQAVEAGTVDPPGSSSARRSSSGGGSTDPFTSALRSFEAALSAVAGRTEAWSVTNSVKDAVDADDWLRKFGAAAEGMAACVVISDMTQPGAPMVYVNAAFCKVTGYSREESVGRNCRFLQGPDTEPEAIEMIRQRLGKGLDCHVKITNYRKNGERFQNLLSMKPVFDDDGTYRYVIGVQFEIVADKGLKKRISHLDSVLSTMPTTVHTHAAHNNAAKDSVDLLLIATGSGGGGGRGGGSAASTSSGSVSAVELEAALSAMDSALDQLAANKAWSSKPLPSGNACEWLSRFTAAAEAFPACIVVSEMTLPGAPMVYVNRAFCRVTGYAKEDAEGRNCRFLQGPDTELSAVNTIRQRLSKGQDCYVYITNYRKTGEKFTNLLSLRPIYDAAGVYRYVIGVQFEVIADEGLATRLGQLERMLRLMPTNVDGTSVTPTGETAKAAFHRKPEVANLLGEAYRVIDGLGVPPPARE